MQLKKLPHGLNAELVHQPPDGLCLRRDGQVVIADELRDARAPGRVKAQARENALRQLGALGRVAVEMPDTVRPEGEARRLADIVQQRRPAQHRLRRDVLHNRGRVQPDVPVMVRVVLLEAEHRPQLRDRDGQHIGKFPQHCVHVLPAEELCQLAAHALRREILQQRAIAMDGRCRLRRDLKAEHGRKAQRAQDAQPVLLKAAVRLAHAAHNAARNVLRPAADVDQPRARMVGQRVHREIAAQQILAQAARKAHGVRPPVVGIVPVDAVGRDLKRQAVEQDGHGAVPEPRLDEPLAGKDALDLRGLGIGRDVPIPRRTATQRVAHSPADDIGLPARRRETIERRMHL